MSDLAIALDDSVTLCELADASGVSAVQAKAILIGFFSLPVERRGRIERHIRRDIDRARQERIRTLTAKIRSIL